MSEKGTGTEGSRGPSPHRSEWDVQGVFREEKTASRASIQFFTVLLLLVGAVGFRRFDWTSGLALYGTLEAVSSVLALVTGALALVRFYTKKQEAFLFIGTGFLGTGLLDLFPAVLATGWIGRWTAEELEGLATWSFTASGIFLSLFLLASWFSWRRHGEGADPAPVREVTVYLIALLLAVVTFAVFDLFPLRGALRPERLVRQPAEFIPGIIFLGAAVGYLARNRWRWDAFEQWLAVGLLVGVMAHGAYMPFSSQYHDALFVAAHGLKVVSYGCVLIGLLASVYVTFRREEEVAETTREANDALAREIDFRRRAEKVIQESEARLQDFLDNAHDLIQSIDPAGRLVYVNRMWKKVLGYSEEELEDLNFFQIVHPGCREGYKADFKRLLRGEDLPTINVDLVASDGRVVRCSGSADLWSEEGNPVAVRSILRDITEQMEAKEELEAFQANLQALVENTGDAIWSVDRSMRLITFNTAFSMATEVRTNREPRVGDRPEEFLPPKDVDWYTEMYDRALAGETFSELRDEELDGQIRSFEFFFNPIREAAGITGVAAFGQDVTARRRTQMALKMAKEEAEQANRAKSQFLASMSHELRTPLNSVIGFTNILLKNRSGNLGDQELGFLERITANGKHLLELINEVLDLAKIEAGRMEMDPEEVDLHALLEETVLQLEGQVRDQSVTLRSEVPKEAHPLQTDRGKLKQVVINLVGNALKFTKEGEVVVRVSLAEDGRTPSVIAVQDTGIGISEDRLQAIFEAFQQAEASTHREYGGTGLGLTISRSLCQLMGFDLRVESEEGVGSTFSVLLTESRSPERQAEEELMEEALRPMESSRPAASAKGARPIRLRKARALVVDDDANARAILRQQLQDMGCQVAEAESVEHGVRMAKEMKPDLITLDPILPEMTGWEALKVLKGTSGLSDIPVVVISVAAGAQDRGNLLGPVDLLTKPVDQDELTGVLRRNLTEIPGRRVLVVEDEPSTRDLILRQLRELNVQATPADHVQAAVEAMKESTPDLILLDLMMLVMDGSDFLDRLRSDPDRGDIPVVLSTGENLLPDEKERLAARTSSIFTREEAFKERLEALVKSFFASSWRGASLAPDLGSREVEVGGHDVGESRDRVVEEAQEGEAGSGAGRVRESSTEPAQESSTESAPPPATESVPEPLKILYAEDDLLAAEVVKRQLGAEGFEVLHFENGREALDAALETAVDGAILDVKMPGMDGFELLKRLRREPSYENLPIMMLTTMNRKEDIGRGYDLGADDYMIKPASPVEVLDRMRRLLKYS